MKNTQTSQQHTNAFKYLKNVSDTALESLHIILFRTNYFGYHTAMHGTWKDIHSIENCWIKQFTLTHKWNITKTHCTPVVPKILSSKNKTSRLSNAVSIIPLTFLYQNAHNLKHWWIYSISRHISKYEFFFEKSAKNFKLYNIVKTHPGMQKMCPTRRWKV